MGAQGCPTPAEFKGLFLAPCSDSGPSSRHSSPGGSPEVSRLPRLLDQACRKCRGGAGAPNTPQRRGGTAPRGRGRSRQPWGHPRQAQGSSSPAASPGQAATSRPLLPSPASRSSAGAGTAGARDVPGGAPEMGDEVGAGPPGRQPRPEQSHPAQWDPSFRRGQGALGPLSKEWPLTAPWPGMGRAHSAALETQANPGHPQPRPRLSGYPRTQPAALPGGGGATTSRGTQTG